MTTTPHQPTVAVVGDGGGLARRVVSLLESSPGGGALHVDDVDQIDGLPAGVRTLVHLDRWPCPTAEGDRQAKFRRLVTMATDGAVEHVVVVSSAAVYGAWADNPVPLCEDAVLRPNPGGDYALAKAENERRWAAWVRDRPGATLAVLRPALVVGDDDEQWLAVALRAATRWGTGDPRAPTQFVHADDLASAVALAVEQTLEGVYNVAPEGWLAGAEVQELTGTPLRPPIPPALAAILARWCWSRGLGGVAPEWIPYATHSWVVASDRLRAEGWTPDYNGAETLVASYPMTPWARLGPKARRTATLAVGAVVGLGPPAGALALVCLRRRRRRAGRRPGPASQL
ncbi:MAG: NAD-dependent epimerase/dehydratase family protein [Actinomycetota bacterium]|nr:NAD-dependent epimerase/dehydratase family protein [Actinomycetota bacterium]